MTKHDGERPLTSEERNPYASASRWRHQESSAFAHHAAARSPVGHGSTGDLADFLNSSRVEPQDSDTRSAHSVGRYKPIPFAAVGGPSPLGANFDGAENASQEELEAPDGKEIVCGPLLNYRRMDAGRWYGSVLVVVRGGGKTPPEQPYLTLRPAGHALDAELAEQADLNGNELANGTTDWTRVEPHCLYSDPRNTFWAFDIDVPIATTETIYEYEIPEMRYSSDEKPRKNVFVIPAATESMRIMFHSCNGFSVGTDEEAWSGPALWNDVVRKHRSIPFHVMIGGGDQIYNDGRISRMNRVDGVVTNVHRYPC